MNWKEIGLKALKGAFSGITAIMGGLFVTGTPIDSHTLKIAGGAILSAGIHGAWNAADQYLNGPTK